MNNTKAIILARVSTTRQEEEGLSLDNQMNTLRNYAKERGFEVVQEFRFSESADSKIRSKFLEMVGFVKGNADVQAVIAYRVDRITRNFRDAVLMDDLRNTYGKELHFVYDRLVIGPKTVGREITDWDTKVYLAKQVMNRLKEDAHISIRYKVKNGEWPWHAPYGYANIQNEDGKKWIAPDPKESRIVIKAYEWYSTGAFSMDGIRAKTKEVFGANLSKGLIDYILKQTFYYGEMKFDGKLLPHRYQTIISKQLFDRVQSVKLSFGKKPFKFAGLPYLYRGLLRCGECGCAFTPEKKTKKSGKRYVYYHCTQYHGKCGTEWIREEEITAQLAQIVEGIHVPDDVAQELLETLRESHQDKIHFHKNLLTDLQNEDAKLQKRIEKMYDELLRVSITKSIRSFGNSRRRFSYGSKPSEARMRITISLSHAWLRSPTKLPCCSRVLNRPSNGRF